MGVRGSFLALSGFQRSVIVSISELNHKSNRVSSNRLALVQKSVPWLLELSSLPSAKSRVWLSVSQICAAQTGGGIVVGLVLARQMIQ